MSKRGSNNNSSLFMADPVPIRRGKLSNINKEGTIFVKGESNTTFKRIDGNGEMFEVKSPSGSFKLDRVAFKDSLRELKSSSQIQIKLLKEEQVIIFNSIAEALRLLYGAGKLYEMIHTDIQEIYSDIKVVIPGTLGAFFIGCSSSDNFTGPMGCNPKCAASLPPGEKTPGYSICDDLVLIYDNNEFVALNSSNSTHVWIHVNEHFNGFTNNNIDQLKDADITHVTLIYGNPDDGNYKEIKNRIPVDQLPLQQETPAVVADTTTTDDTGANAIFFIIIIVIIIILLIILYNSARR